MNEFDISDKDFNNKVLFYLNYKNNLDINATNVNFYKIDMIQLDREGKQTVKYVSLDISLINKTLFEFVRDILKRVPIQVNIIKDNFFEKIITETYTETMGQNKIIIQLILNEPLESYHAYDVYIGENGNLIFSRIKYEEEEDVFKDFRNAIIKKGSKNRNKKSTRKSPKKSNRKTTRKSPKKRKTVNKKNKSKCKDRLSGKIKINMNEFKSGRYSSKEQAIAVAYSQILKKYPHCKKVLNKKE